MRLYIKRNAFVFCNSEIESLEPNLQMHIPQIWYFISLNVSFLMDELHVCVCVRKKYKLI